MLEKLALLKIAFCKAPVLSRASSRRTSEIAGSGHAGKLPVVSPAAPARAVIANPLVIRSCHVHEECQEHSYGATEPPARCERGISSNCRVPCRFCMSRQSSPSFGGRQLQWTCACCHTA